jgi:2-oxoglutarate ferredoxin oxidoreductase subunit alpha
MNTGQMLDDILLYTQGRVPVEFYGRPGGVMPFPDEILNEIHRMTREKMSTQGHPRDRWFQRAIKMTGQENGK